MPTYEYQCRACGGGFEVRRSISDKPRTQPCPQCESTQTAQRLSGGRAVPRGRSSRGSGGGGCGDCSKGMCGSCTRH